MTRKLAKIIAIALICVLVPAAIAITVVCFANAEVFALSIATVGFENVGSITYSVNGKAYSEKVNLKKGSEVTVSVETEGYDFVGWFDKEDNELSKKVQYTFVIESDTELTAKSEIIQYSVSYDGEDAVAVKYKSSLKVNDNIADTGDVFKGWTQGGNTTVYRTADFGEKTSDTIQLTSKYDKTKYNITYKDSDGKVLNSVNDVEWGTVLAVGQNKTSEGKNFKKWTYNGTEVSYAQFGFSKNIILVATYDNVSYNVSYNGEAASNVEWNSVLANYAGEVPAGKEFAGWVYDGKVYTNANFGEVAGTVNLTPSFRLIEYAITYTNTKDAANSNSETYTVEDNANLADLSKEGYTFDGWYIDETKVTTTEGRTGDLTLTAHWTAITYTVTFDANKPSDVSDAVTVPDNIENVKYDEAVSNTSFTDPSIENYIFLGWYTDNTNYTTKVTNESRNLTTIDGETVTLYAKWTTEKDIYTENDTYRKITVHYESETSSNSGINPKGTIAIDNSVNSDLQPTVDFSNVTLFDATGSTITQTITVNGTTYTLSKIVFGADEDFNDSATRSIAGQNLDLQNVVTLYKDAVSGTFNYGDEVEFWIILVYEA